MEERLQEDKSGKMKTNEVIQVAQARDVRACTTVITMEMAGHFKIQNIF